MIECDEELTDAQHRIKKAFMDDLGFWIPEFDALLHLDAEYLERFRALAMYPREADVLEPKIQAFVRLAMDCATTQLYGAGTRRHVGAALDHGATLRELVEVMELASGLGFHSVLDGTEILVEVAGAPDVTQEQRAKADRLREEWANYWDMEWNDIAAFDTNYLETVIEFNSHPWQDGVLSPRVKELVYIAIDVGTTHLYKTGLRFHVENALENTDVTPEDIFTVFEIGCAQGINTVSETLPIILDEAEKRDALHEGL